MASASPCPQPETLDDLLANRLSAARADEVRAHIAGCADCRQKLGRGSAPPASHAFLSPPRDKGELGWLGDYRITGVLGEGGMAIVFDAEEPLLHRRVALKVLKPQNNDATTRERFLREARALASLPSEHVVHIYAVGEDNGVPYLAMERLRGESLATLLKRDRWLAVGEALKIAREAAEGLAVLHDRDLVHRDIKPENIWLESDRGRFKDVKLIDFGIARMVSSESGLTLPGQIVGTPAYMSPEQAAGQPVDGRTDLYSLGCVLYKMVTGYTPFDNAAPGTMMVLEAVIKGDAPRVREAASNLSPPVAELIQQLMARDPASRPASAAVVVERLRQLEQEERVNTSTTRRFAATADRPPRRGPRRAGLIGIVLGGVAILAALVVGAVAAYHQFWPASTPQEKDRSGKGNGAAAGPPLKVGVLFSQSDTTAVHELPLIDAVRLAIDEINDAGGVLGRKLVAVVEDGGSREKVFEERAVKLIEKDGVEVIFGCWTSSSRKRVGEVCRQRDRLLFFPAGDEGLEESPNVVYLGGTPNQTVIPLVKYAYADLQKRKFFLVGSEYLYSHAVNAILEHEIKRLGGKVVGQRYVLLGETDLAPVIADIKKSKADIVINSIDGSSDLAFFQALRSAGVRPQVVPTAWLAISEPQLGLFRAAGILGDYSAGCYFEGLDTPANRAFVGRFRKQFGPTRRINDTMQTAYAGVHLWKKAVEKAGSTDTAAVRQALRGMSIEAPDGPMKIDGGNLHAWRTARVGKVVSDEGRLGFQIVHQTPGPVAPEPFPDWRTKEQWQEFLHKLYIGWGNAWEKHK